METYILYPKNTLSVGDEYRLRTEDGTVVSDADLEALFSSDGKARFILNWNGQTSSSRYYIRIKKSDNTSVLAYTSSEALIPSQLYEGTWTGGGATFTSFTPVEGKTLSEDQMSFLMGQIKSAQSGGIKTLTTADYNYPTDNPTMFRADLAEAGVYKISSDFIGTFPFYASSTIAQNLEADDMFIKVGTDNANISRVLILKQNGTAFWQKNIQTLVSIATEIRNSLTSTEINIALSAAQGKVLKDLIDSLVIENAGAPTTSTVGTVGMLLEDTTNGKLYQCTAVNGSTYTWTEVGGGGSSVQSDWAQSDPEAADYIKNRIAYESKTITSDPERTNWTGPNTAYASANTDAARKTAMMNAGWTEAQADFYNAHKAYSGTIVPCQQAYDAWGNYQDFQFVANSQTYYRRIESLTNDPVTNIEVSWTDGNGDSFTKTITMSKLSGDTSTDGFVRFGYANFTLYSDPAVIMAWQDSLFGLIFMFQGSSAWGYDSNFQAYHVVATTDKKTISADLLPDATATVKGGVTLGQIGGAVQNGDYLRKYTTTQDLTALDLRQSPIIDWESTSLTSPETIKNKPFGSIPAGATYPFGITPMWYQFGATQITSASDTAAQWLGITQTDLDNAASNTISFVDNGWTGEYYWLYSRVQSPSQCEYLDTLADLIDAGGSPTVTATGTYTENDVTTNVSFSFSGFTKGADGVYRSAKEIDSRWDEWGNYSTFYGMCFEKITSGAWAGGYRIYISVPTTYSSTTIWSVYPYSSERGSYSLAWGITTTAAVINQIDASYIPLDMTVFQIVDGKITLRS